MEDDEFNNITRTALPEQLANIIDAWVESYTAKLVAEQAKKRAKGKETDIEDKSLDEEPEIPSTVLIAAIRAKTESMMNRGKGRDSAHYTSDRGTSSRGRFNRGRGNSRRNFQQQRNNNQKADSTPRKANGRPVPPNTLCYNCNGSGHTSATCTTPPRNRNYRANSAKETDETPRNNTRRGNWRSSRGGRGRGLSRTVDQVLCCGRDALWGK